MPRVVNPYGEFNNGYDDGLLIPETENVGVDGKYLDLIRTQAPGEIGHAAGIAMMLFRTGDTESAARILAEVYQTPFMPNARVFEDYEKIAAKRNDSGLIRNISLMHLDSVEKLRKKNREMDDGFLEGREIPALPSDYERIAKDPKYAREINPADLGYALGATVAIIGRTEETVAGGCFNIEAFSGAIHLAYTPLLDERLPFAREYYEGLREKTKSAVKALERNGHYPRVLDNLASAVKSLELMRNPNDLRGYPFPLE